MSNDQDPEDGEQETAEVVGNGVEAAAKAGEMASKIAEGDAAGAVAAGLGAAGGVLGAAGGALGEDEGEARQGVQTAATVVDAAGGLIGAGQGIAAGDASRTVGGLGSAAGASQYLVPDHEAQQVLSGASQAVQAGSQLVEGLGDAVSSITGGSNRHDVTYHLELDGFDATWGVHHVDLREEIGSPYECIVRARCSGAAPEVSELLSLDVHLQIERSDQMRSVHGLVRHATVAEHGHAEESEICLHIVPAMWLLGQNLRSRVFVNKTVPEVVEAIYQERVGTRQRSIRNDLTRTYPTHELLVQHQETDLQFVQRRLEQEGIFTYFVHDGDHEVLVLADANTNLENAREADGGRVNWYDGQTTPSGGEGISAAVHYEEVGTQDVVVSEYNWTAPDAPIRGEETGHSELDPPLELYDHTGALTLHSYDGTRYGENDASDQARMRAEVLDLRRHRWRMTSNLVAARPGHVVELSGCPDGSLDGRYVIVTVSSEGTATEGSSGDYESHMTLVPRDVPFRPARRTPVPVLSGYQSAMVVGPTDQEIHTDEHGRVQIRFPWDREHEPSDYNLCSCWVRVMHSWSGPGFGTTFIPRIGMEVVVSFLNGNPDRPLVVGCLYHGTNHSPVATPDDKTQSAIRTKSSPNSDGFNELRFEDKAGSEFIFTHAQKDYNEVVEHNHSTHVKNNQSNTVDVNQTETIGNDQTMTVHHDRTKTVDNDEWVEVGHYRSEIVHGNEDWVIEGQRARTVKLDELLTVQEGNRTIHVQTGSDSEKYDGGRKVEVKAYDNLRVEANRNIHVKDQLNITVQDGHYALKQGNTEKFIQASPQTYIESAEQVHIKVGPSHVLLKSDGTVTISTSTTIGFEVGGSKIEMSAGAIALEANEIQLKAGESSLKLEASKATLKGAMVDLLADMFATIKGTLVRIN